MIKSRYDGDMTEKEFAERLLHLWDDAHDNDALLNDRYFAAWSGATKDLLLGLGLEWDQETDSYVILSHCSISESWLPKAMVKANLAASTSQASQLIQQGGVMVDGAIVKDPKFCIQFGKPVVVSCGTKRRRSARIQLI